MGSGSLVQVVEQAAMMHESRKAAWILMKWGFFMRAICGYGLEIRVGVQCVVVVCGKCFGILFRRQLTSLSQALYVANRVTRVLREITLLVARCV